MIEQKGKKSGFDPEIPQYVYQSLSPKIPQSETDPRIPQSETDPRITQYESLVRRWRNNMHGSPKYFLGSPPSMKQGRTNNEEIGNESKQNSFPQSSIWSKLRKYARYT